MPLRLYLVDEVMTPNLVFIESEAPLAKAEQLMDEHNVRRLPVIEGGRLVGIISKGDLREAHMAELSNRHPYEPVTEETWLTVAEAMSHPVVTVTPQTLVVETAQLMLEHKIGALPVLEAGRLVGILTDTDVIRLLVRETQANEETVSCQNIAS
ncbi:MAG: CBS domain-containing protein [Chloroflexi bacterium]|nr:CBS domain-containing protein [Chloroflexota bacterium]